jgi:hypothetical protein
MREFLLCIVSDFGNFSHGANSQGLSGLYTIIYFTVNFYVQEF